jgi:hypothetical protein
MFLLRYGVLLLVVGLLGGCAAESKVVPVKGKVTLDGAPMATGQVLLDPGDGTAPTTLEVTGGAFAGKTPVGKKTVRISSFKKAKQQATGPGAEEEALLNIIPARYNNESTETVEVTKGGPNQFDFKVTSK